MCVYKKLDIYGIMILKLELEIKTQFLKAIKRFTLRKHLKKDKDGKYL